jgi:hypothetical protein
MTSWDSSHSMLYFCISMHRYSMRRWRVGLLPRRMLSSTKYSVTDDLDLLSATLVRGGAIP